nr:hypothetical protein [Sicyoidochytrium minutum DNA virus]
MLNRLLPLLPLQFPPSSLLLLLLVVSHPHNPKTKTVYEKSSMDTWSICSLYVTKIQDTRMQR